MNEVSIEKQGHAGGIVLTSQLVGGAVGMAICSALYLTNGAYHLIFLIVGALTAFTLLLAYLKIAHETKS